MNYYKIAEKKLQFLIEIADNFPTILILDEIRLRQVMLNLIGNAMKFTDAGYIKVIVTSENFDSSSNTITLVIKIEDTGIGIPEYEKNRIFESFTQVKGQDTKKYGGTGLGLAISKKLIQLMNGEISLTSVIKKGTTFVVVLKNITVGSDNDIEQYMKSFTKSKINSKTTEFIDIGRKTNNQEITQVYKNFTTPLSSSQVENLKVLYTILKEEKFSLWQATQEIIDMDAILNFTKDMMNLANQYQYANLFEWAKEVEKHASMYNIEKMSEVLIEFPKILAPLKLFL